MTRPKVLAGVVLTATVGAAGAASAAPAKPTFNQDVAPIFYAKCASCHRPGEVAPMSLVKYEDARPWARSIKAKVATREMPPWSADRRFGRFVNDPSLTPEEIATIVAWVDAGAARGAGSAPAEPTFVEGWRTVNGRPPDVILEMPMEYPVPAEGQVPNFMIWAPNPFAEDKFIEAIQIRPGALSVTHHSALYGRPLPEGTTLKKGVGWKGGPELSFIPTYPDGRTVNVLLGANPGAQPPTQADTAVARSSFQVDGAAGDNRLLFFLPGGGFQKFPPGAVKRLSAANALMWELHYSPNGTPQKDVQRIGLWFAQTPPQHEVVVIRNGETHIAERVEYPRRGFQGSSASDVPNIPPYAENWKLTAIQPVKEDITLYAFTPHMHLRGQDMTYVATYPDGREEVLLHVPKYDFNWQLEYELAEPVHLPAGSTIKTIGHFDNSLKNSYNPAPDRPAYWSEQTWDEMFNGFIEISYDRRAVRPLTSPVSTGGQ